LASWPFRWAEANEKVMTGYLVSVVHGSGMVEVNPNAGPEDSLAIQACAADVPVAS
jgi:hypothetical protein